VREGTFRNIVVHADVDDAYDGITRLLADAQRLGFDLTGLNLEADAPENLAA
jgi:hypothetical protein